MKSSNNRRDFIKKISVLGGISVIGTQAASAMFTNKLSSNKIIEDGKFLKIKKPEHNYPFKPLEEVLISSSISGKIVILDGNGNQYFEKEIGDDLKIKTAGALGTHVVLLINKKDDLLDIANFKLDAKTEINDKGDEFRKMLDMLHFSVRKDYGSGHFFRIHEKLHFTYAGWFQDHVHVTKAMKYFYPDVQSGIDMWALGQREDGMLADNCYQGLQTYKSWLNRFGNRFVWKMGPDTENSTFNIRIPVENMSEFTFLDAVYYSWKASGDDEWMAEKIENCLKAIKYATTDAYRWSEKFQLLKRGYTIDIWDFQPAQDVKVFGGDVMMAKPGVTNYSVMYGDNVGFYVGCEYVGEMLEYLKRNDEAKKIRELGRGIKERLDKLSWNGEFYTQHVPEDPSYKRDFGNTYLSKQITISNSYAINRRIGHDKSVALIKTYQRIKEEMPKSSPGEWYLCYPPYEKGYREKWEYMNGGVTSIVAGEVSHGAFEHGFEDYGVDILRRTTEMAKKLSNNEMKCIYRGAMPELPQTKFTPINLKSIANADTHGKGTAGVQGFTNEGVNDFHNFPTGKQVFQNVDFDIVDLASNGRKACLILSGDKGYTRKAVLDTNKKASSIYVVHAQSYGTYMGDIILNYTDGTTYAEHIVRGQNIAGWWYPNETGRNSNFKVAWEGENEKSNSVGAYIFGFNNPEKNKTIKSIEFSATEGNQKWIVMGITLSDQDVFFMPSPASFGAPDNWGAAAIIYAMIEGLAGIKDTGVAFNKASLAPRWEASGVTEVEATAKYESSGGYLSYKYKKINDNQLEIEFTGNSLNTEVDVLIPKGKKPTAITLNGSEVSITTKKVENSLYAIISAKGVNAHKIEVKLA